MVRGTPCEGARNRAHFFVRIAKDLISSVKPIAAKVSPIMRVVKSSYFDNERACEMFYAQERDHTENISRRLPDLDCPKFDDRLFLNLLLDDLHRKIVSG